MSLRGPGENQDRRTSSGEFSIDENEPPDALRDLLDRHFTQQFVVARLSQRAIGASLDEVMEHAVEVLREGLKADATAVFELLDEERELERREETGWQAGSGEADAPDERRVRVGPATSASRALSEDPVVLIDDWDSEERFGRTESIEHHDVGSSLVVRIPGPSRPFGLLVALSRAPGQFSEDDFDFVRTVANLLGESSDREHAEKQRSLTDEGLHAALRAREEMLAVISHDLRSPASAIKLSLEVVRRAVHDPQGPIKPELVERAIHKANSNIDRMMTLMEDLLTMSRTETDSFDIEWEQVDLRDVVDEVVLELREAIASTDSQLEVRGAASMIGRWNWVRLQQVVSNLVSNAIKYGEGKPIIVELSGDEDTAILSVSDQGRGIPKSQQERIFKRFVRIDHREHEQMEDSYGLGLWIVERIVTALKGTIEVDSTPDQGTTFRVQLPRSA